MPHIAFTANLRQHVACPEADVAGGTVADVLSAYFTAQPQVRGYVLDERGALRKHMALFIDGEMIHDRDTLTDPLSPQAQLWVMQALSGG